MTSNSIVYLKRLESQTLNARDHNKRDLRYSIVFFDGCNSDCIFCFERDKDPDGTPRQNLGAVDFSYVKDFVVEEVKKGHRIKLTGGEATLQAGAALELLKVIKGEGGYAALDTNGSNPALVEKMAPYLDKLGLDIKSPPDKIEFYTGKQRLSSYDNPLQTLKESKEYSCMVEFKRVMFKVTTSEDLEHFYEDASHAHWVLKQSRPYPQNQIAHIDPSNKLWVEPIEDDRIIALMNKFVSRHPDLENRIVSIIGSSSNWANFHYPPGSTHSP